MLGVLGVMVVPHTDLTEVTRMVLVEVDAHVVLTTSLTTTSRMLPVLTNTTMTSGDVASQLSGFLKFGSLKKRKEKEEKKKGREREKGRKS